MTTPKEPGAVERSRFELPHMPYRSWCFSCVAGRAADDAHRMSDGYSGLPRVECDFMFLSSRVHLASPGSTIFNMIDRESQSMAAALSVKAASDLLVRFFLAMLDAWGRSDVKVLLRSNARQLSCVFQDMKPPKSILRKSTDMRKPIQRVKFTKAIARHTKIRDQHLSLGYICPGEPHQRSPNAPKFEDRSQEETEWQEQGAREAAWKLAKSALNVKDHERATSFSLSENRCLPASTLKPEEREFVVDSRASEDMISKKDLNSAELETLTKSCSPTIVTTANGEVQTHEEATVYVKELDLFLTMKVLEDTTTVLSVGKLCDEHGYSYEWINGQKPHLIKNGIRIQCNAENFVPIAVLGLSTSSSSSLPSSTPMTPSRQEVDRPTSSSSSSTSPTTTSSTVSSERVYRQERGDPCG